MFYAGKDFLNNFGLTGAKTLLWHVGITEIRKEMEEAILRNNHTLLIEDSGLRKKYQSYLNIDYIPEEYKKGKIYYSGYNSEKMQSIVYPQGELDENSVFKKDPKLANAIKNLLTVEGSPGLADDEILKQLPKAYIAVVEWDAIKDHGLIYAGRLRANGVPVEIGYFEGGFHGIANYVDTDTGYIVAQEILNGIINFVNKSL
jgi:acetyl esterase/lipase